MDSPVKCLWKCPEESVKGQNEEGLGIGSLAQKQINPTIFLVYGL